MTSQSPLTLQCRSCDFRMFSQSGQTFCSIHVIFHIIDKRLRHMTLKNCRWTQKVQTALQAAKRAPHVSAPVSIIMCEGIFQLGDKGKRGGGRILSDLIQRQTNSPAPPPATAQGHTQEINHFNRLKSLNRGHNTCLFHASQGFEPTTCTDDYISV